jgi:hypothetical protein
MCHSFSLLILALHIPSSWCGAAHPFIPPWHCSIIFLVWRCTSLHLPMALLNHFSGVALHIPTSSRGTAQSFFLCGAAHPFILPCHCSIIFLAWRCTCTSLHPPVALLNHFLMWRCTSLYPPVALLNNFSCVALHIPSSSCGTTQSFSCVALHIPLSSRGTAQ